MLTHANISIMRYAFSLKPLLTQNVVNIAWANARQYQIQKMMNRNSMIFSSQFPINETNILIWVQLTDSFEYWLNRHAFDPSNKTHECLLLLDARSRNSDKDWLPETNHCNIKISKSQNSTIITKVNVHEIRNLHSGNPCKYLILS